MSLVDLIKKEDDKYISVSAFIKLVSNHTKDSDDLVIEYLGKFCLSDRYEQVGFYTKNSGNGYTRWLYLSNLICKEDKTDGHRFYIMSELEKSDKFLTSYFLKDEIFNASFIKSLNLNPNSYKKPFIDVEVIDNPIDRDLDQNDQNYISALKYVNDLGKGIGSGKPLKLALEYLVKNISFSEVELYLYDAGKEKYFLVSQTDSLDYTTSTEVLKGIYDNLDSSQRGINFSDTALEPFKGFHFEFSELPDLRSSADDKVVPKQLGRNKQQLPTPHSKPLSGNSQINNLGENQRLLITYAFFTAEDMTCLIIDYNPAYINCDDNYLRHRRMVYNAIDAGSLTPDDKDRIPAEQVKEWLANHDFIYKGFNDNLTDFTDTLNKENITYKNRIAELEQQLVDTSFMMGSPTIEQGESKESEQIISDLRDKVAQLTNDNASLKNQLTQQAESPADDKELSGLAKYNSDKAYTIATSQALASYIWSMDTEKAIRTGDMVHQVRQVMHNVAPQPLPDNERIREWLSSIAPEYAKKGGKTPNNAPNEISLTMKK